MTGSVHSWEDDAWCYVCGAKNPEGLKLTFTVEGDELTTSFIAEKRHQGYRDVLHGGVIGMVLDEVMILLPYRRLETITATAEFSVRLIAPVTTGTRLTVRAGFAAKWAPGQRLYRVAADARREDGMVVASATGTCVKVR